jgi:hypothetical protein
MTKKTVVFFNYQRVDERKAGPSFGRDDRG